jgi:hypothetical protein
MENIVSTWDSGKIQREHLCAGLSNTNTHRVKSSSVSVKGDDTQVPYGCSTVEDIGTQPEVAHDPSKHPVTQTLIDCGQG